MKENNSAITDFETCLIQKLQVLKTVKGNLAFLMLKKLEQKVEFMLL